MPVCHGLTAAANVGALRSSETLPLTDDALPIRSLQVEVLEGPDQGKVVRASGDTLTIGTADTNDVVLTDATVSRYHADFVRRGARILVVDHGSTNGTTAGGVNILRGMVAVGAQIRLGKTLLRVSDGETIHVALHEGDRLGPLIGRSAVMRKLMATIERVARAEGAVLIWGETGVGKELVAQAIHENSPRHEQPFETVDCGAVLPALLASELFGHEKGSFTGAEQRHVGALERADGGTLFLDEVGELPIALQSALLGALERRAFRRVGGKDLIQVDVRLLSATNRDLRAEVNAGTFRQDLYYRLAVIPLSIPPLRERSEDIPLLAEHFLQESGYQGDPETILTPAVLDSFKKHFWPGNVRELRNLLEATVAFGEIPELSGSGKKKVAQPDTRTIRDYLDKPYNQARAELIDEFEDSYIKELLARTGGNISMAAREAGMNRSYLTKMLRRRGVRIKKVLPEDEED